jgi:hypothetical protein
MEHVEVRTRTKLHPRREVVTRLTGSKSSVVGLTTREARNERASFLLLVCI